MYHHRQAHFLCAACRKLISIDRRVPAAVIRDHFAVLDLQRATDTPGIVEHPMVCSDECHGKLLRQGLPGYEVTPAALLCQDDDVEVVMPDGAR